MSPELIRELMLARFPTVHTAARHWFPMPVDEAARDRLVLARLSDHFGSAEVLYDIDREPGESLSVPALLRAIRRELGRRRIRLADARFARLGVIAPLGLIALWHAGEP